MSPQLVADFTTQFAAMAAVNKLLSCGLGRENVVVRVYGSVGTAAASASSSTNVISNVSNQGHQGHNEPSESRHPPSHLSQPTRFGEAQVSVESNEGISEDDIRFILELTGAQSIRSVDENFVREDPKFWPDGPRGNSTDVKRAIEASRGGESMPLLWPK